MACERGRWASSRWVKRSRGSLSPKKKKKIIHPLQNPPDEELVMNNGKNNLPTTLIVSVMGSAPGTQRRRVVDKKGKRVFLTSRAKTFGFCFPFFFSVTCRRDREKKGRRGYEVEGKGKGSSKYVAA